MNGVGVIFRDSEGKILLQHRDNKKGISAPNKWCIFGGGIEKGEKPSETAMREMKEELCIDLKAEKLKGLKRIFLGLYTYHIFEYLEPVALEDLDQKEGQDMGFFTREEIMAKKDVFGPFKIFLRLYKVL
jgi:8-oxo-dGTP pyrophosphatase MutT (NUDIX family)